MKQYQLHCQTRVSDTPLEVSPHNSNMINPNKAVTYHIKNSSSACSSLQSILSNTSDISSYDVYNLTARPACTVIPFVNECIWLLETASNELAEMITLPFWQTLSANLLFPQLNLPCPSLSAWWEYIIVSAASLFQSLFE